jgi:hypothetical protein
MSDATRPCEICGQPIDPVRLETVPETRLCGPHARQIEKFGGEFIITGKQTTLSKSGSMKKNYGDVSIDRSRNTLAMEKLKKASER